MHKNVCGIKRRRVPHFISRAHQRNTIESSTASILFEMGSMVIRYEQMGFRDGSLFLGDKWKARHVKLHEKARRYEFASRDSCINIIYIYLSYFIYIYISFLSFHDMYVYFKKKNLKFGSNTQGSILIEYVCPFWRDSIDIQRIRGSNKFFIQTNLRHTVWQGRSTSVLERERERKTDEIPRTGAPVYLCNVHITFFLVIHSGYDS